MFKAMLDSTSVRRLVRFADQSVSEFRNFSSARLLMLRSLSFTRGLVLFLSLWTMAVVSTLIFQEEDGPAEESQSRDLLVASKDEPNAQHEAPTQETKIPETKPVITQDPIVETPSSELLESDAEIEMNQINEAKQLITSEKSSERIEGIERLSAYPSPEVEVMLDGLLISDANAEVRNAAAVSLGSLEIPTEATISELAGALADADETVRYSALSTLQSFMLAHDQASETYKSVEAQLTAKQNDNAVALSIRDAIKEVLVGQTESTDPGVEAIEQ